MKQTKNEEIIKATLPNGTKVEINLSLLVPDLMLTHNEQASIGQACNMAWIKSVTLGKPYTNKQQFTDEVFKILPWLHHVKTEYATRKQIMEQFIRDRQAEQEYEAKQEKLRKMM